MVSTAVFEERLRRLLEEERPPTGGLPLSDIAAETGPVLPLLRELPPAHEDDDFESFEFRECLTVLTLLGRRLALLDLTPTGAVKVVQLALEAAFDHRGDTQAAFGDRAIAAAVEGFVLGREEAVAQQHEQRAAACLRPMRIGPAAFGLVFSGVHDAAVLSDAVDALGRTMLDGGGEVALVDLSQLAEPNRERAAAVFAGDEVTRMLGAVCFFSSVGPAWERAASDARIDLAMLNTCTDFAEGLRRALDASGGGRKTVGTRWRAIVDRWRGGS